jgi:hypothetical protein
VSGHATLHENAVVVISHKREETISFCLLTCTKLPSYVGQRRDVQVQSVNAMHVEVPMYPIKKRKMEKRELSTLFVPFAFKSKFTECVS